MPAFKNLVSTVTVTEGLLVTFDFRRQSGDQLNWNTTTQKFEIIPSAVRDETTKFVFTTEQVESLRVKPTGGNRTDAQIVEILTDRCIENLKGVA